MSGAKCAANANGRPRDAASWALKSLDPRSVMGTRLPCPGNCLNHLAGKRRPEISPQFPKQLREIIARLPEVAAKRTHGVTVAAGCAAQSQIDPSRIQSLQCSELFGNHQRRVIGQHDTAATDADGLSCRRHVANQHRRRGARETLDRMMFGKPETAVPPLFCVTRARSTDRAIAFPAASPGRIPTRSPQN